jgi:hypothetical protein
LERGGWREVGEGRLEKGMKAKGIETKGIETKGMSEEVMKARCEMCGREINLMDGHFSAENAYEYPEDLRFKGQIEEAIINAEDFLKMEIPEHPEPYPESKNTVWKFTCGKCPVRRSYEFEARRFFESPIDWLAHLMEKVWFDGHGFCRFMERLRDTIICS